jgi:hypothetical protein
MSRPSSATAVATMRLRSPIRKAVEGLGRGLTQEAARDVEERATSRVSGLAEEAADAQDIRGARVPLEDRGQCEDRVAPSDKYEPAVLLLVALEEGLLFEEGVDELVDFVRGTPQEVGGAIIVSGPRARGTISMRARFLSRYLRSLSLDEKENSGKRSPARSGMLAHLLDVPVRSPRAEVRTYLRRGTLKVA